MKGLIKLYFEQMQHLEFCAYCTEPKGKQRSCCGENHWLEFSDFDETTQLELINEELAS